MKIYLDLEANAITSEVISIGMVTEEGDEFYSLVRPHTKLDHNIKLLTHISQEEADMAPSLEEVMLAARRFLSIATPFDGIVFYHYGSMDRRYLSASMKYTEDEATLETLEFIRSHCENVDKRVPQHFHRSSIGLRSAYLTMRLSANEEPIQNHNALEDAWMLKYVWENIGNYVLPEGVEPVKVERVNLRYGKGKKKKAAAKEVDVSQRGPNWKLTGKNSSSRHRQAVAIIPAIDDAKFQIPVHAHKKKKGRKEQNSDYECIYHAIGLTVLGNGKLNTAQKIYGAMNAIYDALDTGVKVNGWKFTRIEKQ